MKTVVIGAGRVGCGLLGQLLAEAGHEVVVVARDGFLADRINRHQGYLVRMVAAGRPPQLVRVSGVRAVAADRREQVAAEIADSGLVATAVGARRLGEIAPLVGAGLASAATRVNVVAFENDTDPGLALRRQVAGQIGSAGVAGHGFASGLVFRVVADRSVDPDPRVPIIFTADADSRTVVDGAGLAGPMPGLPGLHVTTRYPAWVRRKLYTFNAAHAAAAYLGLLKGYTYLHAAVRDPQIRPVVRRVADLGQAGVGARYGRELARGAGASHVLPRLENAALDDTVRRVAADPLRKLAAHERLAGAAVCAQEAGLEPDAHALVIAAAIRAVQDEGRSALEPAELLRTVCGLAPAAGTARAVLNWLDRWQHVPTGAVLLDLERGTWAWGGGAPIRSAA
jgi:mannitol-1-phosphate 5-dehydrogenase